MTVRREIAEPHRETSARSSRDCSDVCGGACPAAQTGTGANKKGDSPQQYVERLRGEPAGRQVRRHRACEVERLLDDPGAKKEYRNEF